MNTQTVIERFFHWSALAAWATFLSLILSDVANATSPFEDPDNIQRVAAEHAQSLAGAGRSEAHARLPDTRLRLKACEEPLQTHSNGQGQRLQVQVSCPGLWKIFVPVDLNIKKELVVARRSLQVNEIISADDLTLEWREIKGRGYGHFESVDAVVGRRLARPVAANSIIQPNQVRQALSIHKGDVVTLISRAGPVEIRGRGRAIEDAVENTRLKVRNLSSGRIVEGYARTAGVVEIQG